MQRSLCYEPFEDRILLAIDGPVLLAAIPQTGTVIDDNTTLHFAPREILLRFDSAIDANTLVTNGVSAIQFKRGSDHILNNGNDVIVTPGYVGIEADRPNEVIVRFNENLPDDVYQMTIVGAGTGALKDKSGKAFNNATNLVRPFSLDLGAQVVSIVPQPVTRNTQTGKLSQAVNQIDVYFNANDPLNQDSATKKEFYELIRTQGTTTTTDDTVINPISVTYNATTGKAVLTFDTNVLTTAGTYRLRIGTSEPKDIITTLTPATAGTSFDTASDLGAAFTNPSGTQTVQFTDTITSVSTPVIFPGSPDDPGERPTGAEQHVMGGSNNGDIPVQYYNFKAIYAQFQGQDRYNLITPDQKDRVREVFAYYSYYLGIEFVESDDAGWTIATGDPRVLNATPNVGGVAGGGLAIMNSTVNWGASEQRGSYFTTAMHEIGHLLGQGHDYEVPAVQGGGIQDGVFPGDYDITYAQYLWPALGNDINVYSFTLTSNGKLNIETIAERLKALGVGSNPSQLDTVISLYDSSHRLISRNDDYYGSDSFMQLDLSAGTYYVAITSTGNTEFDPVVENSGFGGRTQGQYQLRMTFTPALDATTSIVDTTGTQLDGDLDGVAGGVHNFWFKVASTLYVDKAATSGTGALGSITNPYTTISSALAAAQQGTIVRIVGNGGADGMLGTVMDNLSYNVGFDSQNQALSDGSKFEVPKGVTVMIDAGAIIKLRGANVNVGTSQQGIDKSGGALQVLGTPTNSVYFTSYYNNHIGTDPGTAKGPLVKGNWGGLVFRDDSDIESTGAFLNYVNLAQISYGGGTVSVGGVSDIYNPVHMVTARPTATFNTITNSADSAMSANPNSFEETEFLGPGFHADYSRVGPKVYGNTFSQNSINGLFIRVRTANNSAVERLTVNARLASTDIVYVMSETFIINGQPGGMINSAATGGLAARPNSRLAIDPGVIMKMGGGRIETRSCAQLIAEGTLDRPIIFTSLYDDRYGAGGTSDTNNNMLATLPSPGNWGGFIFGPTSSGSIDYALVAFAGGQITFEGDSSTMDPVEIDQAQVRITNSTFDFNNLPGGGDRAGRGASDPAVIYIRGAQPVILNNIFQNNTGGAVISANVNSLNSRLVDDWGRSRGPIGLAGSYPTNTGPLIRGNLIGNNSLNGMLVRGGLITTNVIFDDTDIVHVITSTISISNQQVLSGTLRMQSSPTESLVVKLLGTNVDVVAGGELLDIPDRVGGALQIVGTPGHAVVLTSLKDDTVGAGLTPEGFAQTDTRNRKGIIPDAPPDLPNSGPVILDTTARDVHGSSFPGRDGWDALLREVNYVYTNSTVQVPVGNEDRILYVGLATPPPMTTLTIPYSREAIDWVATQLDLQVDYAETFSEIAGVNFANYKMVYIPSDSGYPLPEFRDDPYNETNWWGGITGGQLSVLINNRKGDLINYVNNQGGGLLVMAEDNSANPYGFIAADSSFVLRKSGGNVETATEFAPAGFSDVGLTDVYLNEGTPYRSVFEGPTNFNRLVPWSVDPVTGEVAVLGNVAGGPGVGAPWDVVSPADWGSLRLDVYSNDRNVEIINEVEQRFTSSGDANQTPATSQLLGELAKDQVSGDDNVRLGFEVHGALSQATNSPGGADVDVYSFRGTAGTAVWLDLDRTASALDSVVELVDANGAVIARSDNSVEEAANNSLLVGSARPMQVGSLLNNPSPFASRDFYTTNPKDAGMRVDLPGAAGSVNTYFVRVRSSSNNLTNLTGGLTKGAYVLQVRLQEVDEFPGSTIRYADIRYANDGIEAIGKPESSPLYSNTAQSNLGNNSFTSAQDLGNLLESNHVTLDVAGSLDSPDEVDWYKFSLNYEQIQSIKGLNDGLRTFAAMLQVNYADGLGRANTTMSLYDDTGTLLMISRDGQIADSLPRPNIGNIGADAANLSHGSFGVLDPTIGPVTLLAGAPKLHNPDGSIDQTSVVTYYVAISSNATLPEAVSATFNSDVSNPLIRLEPLDSINRVVDDRVGYNGGGITTAGSAGSIFPVSSVSAAPAELNSYADPYQFGDVVLFVNGQNSGSNLLEAVNPFTGTPLYAGSLTMAGGSQNYYDIAMRNDGRLYSFGSGSSSQNSGAYVQLNTANGSIISESDDGLVTSRVTSYDEDTKISSFADDQYAMQYDAFAFLQNPGSTTRRLFAVVHRDSRDDPNPLFLPTPTTYTPVKEDNLLIELNPDTGEVLNLAPSEDPVYKSDGTFGGPKTATNVIPTGILNVNGLVKGMAFVGDAMYIITSTGMLYNVSSYKTGRDDIGGASAGAAIPLNLNMPTGATITGLTAGPLNVEGGAYNSTLFAIDSTGRVYAFSQGGQSRGVFLNGASSIDTGFTNAQGLAFSTLDFNLWHATTNLSNDPGHGIDESFNNNLARTTFGTTNPNELFGYASYYFGLSPKPSPSMPDLPQPGAAAYASNPDIQKTYALPGGAYGTLTSKTFSLEGSSAFDDPTLYFTYRLDTPDINSNISAEDIFRVFASTDGVNWEMLVTSNATLGSELPLAVTAQGGVYRDGLGQGQTEGTGSLRQYDGHQW